MTKTPGRKVPGTAGLQPAGATRAPAAACAKSASEHSILQLQKAAGNRSCAALLGPRREIAHEDRAWLEKASGPLPEISLHEGGPASGWIDAAGAEAGAVGSSVVLPAPGRQASSRRLLLAHEVAHVFQQRAPHLPRGDAHTLEQEADRFASSATSGVSFQIQHSAPVGWAFKMKPEAPTNVGAASTAPATVTPLEEALKNLPKLPPDQALGVLKQFRKVIVGRISTGEGRIRDLMALRAESFTNYLIGGTIEVFGATSLPSDDWQEPWRAVNAAYGTMARRQIKESLENLLAAAEATSRQWETLNEYLGQTEKGADRSIFALQGLQAAGAVAATALTGGGASAVAAGAGYAATTNLAGQATSVAIGIQDRIDWAGLAFDTVFGALTGALGGRFGNAVLKRLMANPAAASLGRRVLAEVVSDLVSGRLSSILHTIGRSLFDQLRGREELTMAQFMERLADQLMDPKGMFLDAIMGRASKMAHAKPTKKQGTEVVKTPEPEVMKTPEPEVMKTPEPEAMKTPETETQKAPEPETQKAPEPETQKAPEPETQKAPEPEIAKAPAADVTPPEPEFAPTLHVSEKRAKQIQSGEKNFAIDRALTFDIDEVLPVGAAEIKPQRAVDRARDPYNRQLLDPNTNQRTKGLGIDPRELRSNRGERAPVSVKDNPNALVTRRFSEVTELKRIFDRALASIKEPGKLKPTEFKARINKETRRIIAEDPGPDAMAVRKALADIGFEYQPGRGFTMTKGPPP
jgi:hypothetical protein